MDWSWESKLHGSHNVIDQHYESLDKNREQYERRTDATRKPK